MDPRPAPDFDGQLARRGLGPLRRETVRTLQVNLGLRCDLACHHCHVESGPKRSEALDRRGVERIVELLAANPGVACLDLTGGAPELHPEFRFLVGEARRLGRRVIDRCNLTVLHRPGQEDTADFLADQGVDVIASLPCYTRENVEQQRGRGVFGLCIDGLKRLNRLGYGRSHRLDLVYNPLGATLPPAQPELETRYRAELRELFGIEFDHLLTITNMPIRRFARSLERDGEMDRYLELLVTHFNAETVPELMCRHMISVAWNGALHDCDFNHALGIPAGRPARSIFDVTDLGELDGAAIATDRHCFGCTAGAGSSCGGALA